MIKVIIWGHLRTTEWVVFFHLPAGDTGVWESLCSVTSEGHEMKHRARQTQSVMHSVLCVAGLKAASHLCSKVDADISLRSGTPCLFSQAFCLSKRESGRKWRKRPDVIYSLWSYLSQHCHGNTVWVFHSGTNSLMYWKVTSHSLFAMF